MKQLWQLWRTVFGVILRHPVTGVSIIARLSDGRVVLVKRRDNQQWSLPGGIVDWGQTLTETVHRELMEETGLQVTQMGRLVGVYSDPSRDPRMHSICVAVEAHVEGCCDIKDPNEILDVRAFTREEIPSGHLSHDHDHHIEDYWNGATVLA